MDLSIHKDIVIEDDSFKMHEEYIWYFIQNVSFSCVRTVSTGLAQAVRYQLSSMHAVKSSMKIVLPFNLHTVAEECLKTLSLGSTGVTDHLSY